MTARRSVLFAAWLAVAMSLGVRTIVGCATNRSFSPFAGDDASDSAALDAALGDASACLVCGDSGLEGTLVVSPASVTLAVVSGQAVPTQKFSATLLGKDVTPLVTWSYARPEIGGVHPPGSTFVPTGAVGGTATLMATSGKAMGTAVVTVSVKSTIVGAGVTATQQSALDNPSGGADPTAGVVYPYADTVFPLGVLAPQIQWNGAEASDVYKLELKEKYFDYVEYFGAAPLPSSHLVADAAWQSVELSGVGPKSDPLAVSLTRLSGATAYAPMTSTWHIAQGLLHGSIYYWELPTGQDPTTSGSIVRIQPGSAQVQTFVNTTQCFGCHTVSRDGTTMAATFELQPGAASWSVQTLDLTQTPAQLGNLQGSRLVGNFSAFNDKGDKMLFSNSDPSQRPANMATLDIVDAVTGYVTEPNVFGQGCGEPAWSPDGKHLAGVCGLTVPSWSIEGWTFDSPTGNLMLADANVESDGGLSVTNLRTLVTTANLQSLAPQASAGRPAYPSFSPDSQWIAFGRPTYGSRSSGADGSAAPGDMWLSDLTGTNVKRLATASSGETSYNPVFSQLRAGGYSWIVFMSRRDYGNQLVGADRQQLWVAAIDDPPTAADPSHPPFYVRGQDMNAKSENAYYALDPCKGNGQSCQSGVDCCTGQCSQAEDGGANVCGNVQGCSSLGNACVQASDCCDAGALCFDGFCQLHPPM
jgi:Tol biopolymer transport system component